MKAQRYVSSLVSQYVREWLRLSWCERRELVHRLKLEAKPVPYSTEWGYWGRKVALLALKEIDELRGV